MKKKIILVFAVMILILFVLIQWKGSERSTDFLDSEFVEIEQLFEEKDLLNTNVSQANVAWHLDHLLKTINQISNSLLESDPATYSSNFNLQRIVVQTSGIIPRGAAQFPANVRPPDVIHLDSLNIQLAEAKKNIFKINALTEKANFEHPVFDVLDRNQTKRFLDVHTNHHLKIIRDILEEEQ